MLLIDVILMTQNFFLTKEPPLEGAIFQNPNLTVRLLVNIILISLGFSLRYHIEIAIRTKCNYVDKLNGVNEHKNNRWI